MNYKPVSTPFNQSVLIGTRWGLMVGLQCDPYQTAALMLYGEWARNEADAICSVLKPGDLALDIGANIGTMAVAMAKRVGRTGMVLAFEPQRAAYCCLCANAALTHCLHQLNPIRAAVGDVDGPVSVPIIDPDKPFNVGGVRLDDPDYDKEMNLPREDVPGFRIDSLGLTRCDVMKIDVETMESRVLAGAAETIQRCQPIIFAETMVDIGNQREVDNINAMLNFLKLNNYDVRRFSPPLHAPDNMRFCPDEIFPGLDAGLVAIPIGKPIPEFALGLPVL